MVGVMTVLAVMTSVLPAASGGVAVTPSSAPNTADDLDGGDLKEQ